MLKKNSDTEKLNTFDSALKFLHAYVCNNSYVTNEWYGQKYSSCVVKQTDW